LVSSLHVFKLFVFLGKYCCAMTDVDITEDAIDTQALQAQIDLSMSFAQNLVSSWMKPHKLSTNSQKKDIENELKEYMRRPPRLGVGAPIPETNSLHREAARLKGKLVGSSSKRQREEADDAEKQISDEEEKSRVVVVKKKLRLDPFASPQGKRKKQNISESNDTTFSSFPFESAPTSLKTLSDTGDNTDKDCRTPPLSPSKKKKAKRLCDDTVTDNVSLNVSNITPSKTLEVIGLAYTPDHASGDTPPKTTTTVDVSLMSTPTSFVGFKNHIAVSMQHPLLNLDGADVESDNESKYSTPAGTPKKKRKRRRKKKKHLQPQDSMIELVSNLS